jgi:hypothetical protein
MANNPHSNLIALAVNAPASVVDEIATLTRKKEDIARGALLVLFAVQAWLGDKVSDLPRPGTKQSNKDNNPEFCFEEKSTANGGTRKMETSCYAAMFRNMPGADGGKALTEQYDEVMKAFQGKADAKAELTAIGKPTLLRMRNRLRSAISNGVTLLRNALKVQHAIWDIQALEHVDLEFATETNAKGESVVCRTEPFTVFSTVKGERDKIRPLSVPTLLRLSPEKAKENGGTFTALMNTLNREGDTSKSFLPPIENVGQFEQVIAELAAFLTTEGGEQNIKRLNEIKRACDPKNTENDGFVVSFVDMFDAIDGVANSPDMRNRYNVAKDRLNKAIGAKEQSKADDKAAVA